MPSQYDAELRNLGKTYKAGLNADISRVMAAIAGASESSIIAVGFGGSFTIASLLCNLHESYTGRVSRAATSLEFICNPTLAASSPVFLISAEGKNPDIIEALRRARTQTSRTVHILTNRATSPLIECAQQLTNINTLIFETKEKDGYLATNSLLLDAVLVARAYRDLDRGAGEIPPDITDLTLEGRSIGTWLAEGESFVKETFARGALLAIYSPPLRPIAADLESKLSESALLHCQLADLRSFAHGRHLWLAQRPAETAVLAIIEPHLGQLWTQMSRFIPREVPQLSMPLCGAAPRDLLAGLVAQMQFVSAVSQVAEIDPGRPRVPQFGRDLHYLDIQQLIPTTKDIGNYGEDSKRQVLGATWPSAHRHVPIRRALDAYKLGLGRQTFRAIVFDYDGTLCNSGSTEPPPPTVVGHIDKLLDHDTIVGIASGRGTSVRDDLRSTIHSLKRQRIRLALYGGGLLTDLDGQNTPPQDTSEFISHATRIVRQLKDLGVPIEKVRPTQPYHVSVRFRDGIHTEKMWFIIADALRQAGLDLSRVNRSTHSVDIVAAGIGKASLIASINEEFKISPYQILTMGDHGAWPGNDYSLLEHRYSLSVDLPSRRLDRGWNLAPQHIRGVDATLWYLERLDFLKTGEFKIQVN